MASKLNQTDYLNYKSLVKLSISKMPDMIKTYIFQMALTLTDWEEFLKCAEDCAWIPLPETKTDTIIYATNREGSIKNNVHSYKN